MVGRKGCIPMTRDNISPSLAIPLATVYGEAANSSPGAWAAIAHVIMNRVNGRDWRHLSTPAAVCMHSGFDACSQNTPLYSNAIYYFENRGIVAVRDKMEALAGICLPIWAGTIPDTTQNSTLYYSPKAQKYLHDHNPSHYKEVPDWNFGILAECFPPNMVDGDDFKFWAYV